jgi:hypothetical protein
MRLSRAERDEATAKQIEGLPDQGGDEENWHGQADNILVNLLQALGYNKTADAFVKLPKWYA